MPRATLPSGIELEYESMGSPHDPALLLVMGFTAQLIGWPEGFCQALADQGHHVIRFDNRDCGLSTHFDGVTVDLGAVMTSALTGGPPPDVPYTLSDMASDAVGLLDHVGLERVHVMGASMGGMIAQHVAIEHPDRLVSLVSIMSMTGEPEVASPAQEAMEVLLTPPPVDRDDFVSHADRWAVWSSRRFFDPVRARERAAAEYDRAFYPEGAPRQLAAIYASGSRAEALRGVRVPTLVIHGRDDTLIPPAGGQRTAELVPTATLLLLADMGHDLPEPLWPVLVDAISSHTRHALLSG